MVIASWELLMVKAKDSKQEAVEQLPQIDLDQSSALPEVTSEVAKAEHEQLEEFVKQHPFRLSKGNERLFPRKISSQ
jgi:predicted exporter